MKEPHRPKAKRRKAKPFILGRAAFAKISAVEGIRMTEAMEAELREYDRQDLFAEERRRLIRRKYGKVRQGE